MFIGVTYSFPSQCVCPRAGREEPDPGGELRLSQPLRGLCAQVVHLTAHCHQISVGAGRGTLITRLDGTREPVFLCSNRVVLQSGDWGEIAVHKLSSGSWFLPSFIWETF